MRIARLTRPDLAVESAAAAQKYAEDQKLHQEYQDEELDAEQEFVEDQGNEIKMIPLEEYIAEPGEIAHMPDFASGTVAEAKKVALGTKKKVAVQTHIRVKNVAHLNKAIRKLKARMGGKVKFSDVLGGEIGDLRVVIRCDAGSIETMEKSKSQVGISGMIQSGYSKVIYLSRG